MDSDRPTTVLDVATQWVHRVRTHEWIKRIANDVGFLRDDPLNTPEMTEEYDTLLRTLRKMEIVAKDRAIELGKNLERVPFCWNPEDPEDS